MRKCIVSSMIRRYISLLPDGQIFTTRDVLQFGMRAAVDKALQRLVFKERIRRLARGVFVKDRAHSRIYSDIEIANAKAAAFGRRILLAPLSIVDPLNRNFGEPECDSTFYIDGHTSSFKIGNKKVTLKHSAPRKLRMTMTKGGEVARALWKMGQNVADMSLLKTASLLFRGEDRAVFRKNIRWMPAWLSDQITFRPWDWNYDKRPPTLLCVSI
jgi:Family of unknown function (DUF6088)